METPNHWLALALGLPFVGSPLLVLLGKRLGHRTGWAALLLPVISLVALLVVAAGVELPGRRVVTWPWIPRLGLALSFSIDGLSLFFGLIVSGMGCLVFFYAANYLGPETPHQGRFYGYLTLFMGAMLGTVFSNNLLLLFVFWELTGLASFLLIGFLHEEGDSRVGARQALLVTASTGLALLAGLIMLHAVTGTYDFAEIAAAGLPFEEHGAWLTAALGLIVVGAFGKSAQIPFHFWLPNAMAAPTPVSAYLHSATMVKLGVFLIARFFPLFVDHGAWVPLLAVIPFTTMLVAAVAAFLAHDLKAILAFSTVSQLGFLLGYYGLGPVTGVEHDYLHILNHVFYKGCLFMVVGIVVHAVGIRDIRHLGGLFRRMPLLAVIAIVATATMAGFPGTTGFLSKEMALTEIFGSVAGHGLLGGYAAGCVVLASIVKVAFSIRLFANIFTGREPAEVSTHFHAPSLALQIPPALLAGAALGFGLFPSGFGPGFGALAVAGLNQPADLQLWHGVTRELIVSALILLSGGVLYGVAQRRSWRWPEIPRWARFDLAFEAGLVGLGKFAKATTRVLAADRPVDYLPILIAFTVAAVGGTLAWQLATDSALRDSLSAFAAPDPLRSFVAALIALAVVAVVVLRRWTTQLIALSVAGFLICFYFVLYRAPDLALTQILVEVVTLFLILILLGRFPRSAEAGERSHRVGKRRQLLEIALALGMGAFATGFVLLVTAAPAPVRVGDFYLANTVPLAAGSNTVNTILVDFRGFDTLGEIAVLVIAMLGGLGLLMRYKRSPEEYRAGPMGPPGFGTSEDIKRDYERT